MKVLAITGYKPMEINIFKSDDERIAYIKTAIEKRLIGFIEYGLEWVLISGKMGVELWTGEVVLDLREKYGLKLAVIPPFENQEERWPEPIRQVYQEIAAIADFYRPLYKGGYSGPYQYQANNKWLIDKSDGCLLLLDEEFPGSNRYFYQEAKETEGGYSIYLITPADLEDVVEEMRMMDPEY
ncbi:Uncharacterized SPBc2 prophage-derived protein YoqJ [Lentibacillus halodurans]|uniref:Uncharacterized SPBc2 prophage-derived protein YoqJ n=1 Tax=Lentibacillus halodurans TaxID=237679 RepID=A0A1I0ZX04_9BACI|nr:SLOG family protein [Lentibacillus halodurans]SFB28858.1 Uncharacterized SPBc2 prophage-derived protein YoqJ [Lentibacillus halodurans]